MKEESISKKIGKSDCMLEECDKDATIEVRSTLFDRVNWWPYCESHGKKYAEKWNRKIRKLQI